MAHWETIQDRSSYVSQVRLVPPKNHSVERGKVIFEAVSKTSIPIVTTKVHTKHVKKSKSMFKSIPFKLLWIFLSITAIVSLIWQCSGPEDNSNKLCSRASNSLKMQLLGTEDAKILLHQSYSRVTQPLISRVNNAHHWIDVTDIIQKVSNNAKTIVELPRKISSEYVSPIWEATKQNAKTYTALWRQQLDDYVEYGNNPVYSDVEVENADTVVEEKIKKTAKRILEYIDQLNEENIKSGMNGDQAKRKAQEIIKEIKEETNALKRQRMEAMVIDKEDDILEFEVKSIMEVAKWERDQLQEQLDILQSRLAADDAEDKDLHLNAALKLEVEYLRANAENMVRERTKQAIDHLQKDGDLFTAIMKERIHLAQRDALKYLRHVYRNIYKTNQIIDNLV